MIKYALRPFVAKPWNAPAMETRYGLWMGVSAMFSESGRQLGEENSRPFALNHHIPAETIACKYEGSRLGCTINMSALRIAMKNFDETLEITDAVRQMHLLKTREISGRAQLGIWDLYILSRASLAIIAYRQRHRTQPGFPGRVPDALASQYQFISGVFMICRAMFDSADPAIAENKPISAQQLYSYADDNGVFISFNDMACAGSRNKIIEFLEFCNHGYHDDAAADRARAEHKLKELVGDPDNWYHYALSAIALDCFIEAEAHRRGTVGHAGPAMDGITSEEIYQSVSRYCSAIIQDDAASDDRREFSDAVLMRQNAILHRLKRPPIRSIAKKHLRKRLGN